MSMKVTMSLTALLKFVDDVKSQTEGVNPDEVQIMSSHSGERFNKVKGLYAIVPPKQIKSEIPANES